LREEFLKERGLNGSEIIALEEKKQAESQKVDKNPQTDDTVVIHVISCPLRVLHQDPPSKLQVLFGDLLMELGPTGIGSSSTSSKSRT
jgi:hypothetical protein